MGKHTCIAWAPIPWGKCRVLFTRNNKKAKLSKVDNESVHEGHPIPDLPFHIITNILLRLPAKCIFQLRHHTRSTDLLYDLTTDLYFMRAHLDQDRDTPTIVVRSRSQLIDNCIELFLFDDKAEYVEATSFDLSSYGDERPTDLWGSYDGFLLFTSQVSHLWKFCIWNPITKEQVTVTSPSRLLSVCGFYFHPCKKEYEVVVCRYAARKFDFQILNLRTKHRRSVGRCSYPPSTKRPPVFINGTFYWMVDCLRYGLWNNYVRPSLSDSILSFNIETEEFSTMEAVVPCNYTSTQRRYPGNEFQLFDLEGELSLFDPSSRTEVVIWVFNNNTKRWDKKHSVISPYHEHKWYFYSCFTEFEYIKMKGEFIAYHWLGTRKYIYNLSSRTWKMFEKKEFQRDRITTTIHTQSLVSLDAADSVIPLKNIDV
ncbi:uncharacterized protein LOC113360279 [Papaver somniferum]|uniref:uncharacterized protein LOC113360279 n=1 Tax=Papaver somniferum TaxID=3469 RepID=UPI000E7032AB|nr:uncharacterized protein LOC113360279 [Papaver somniferum]